MDDETKRGALILLGVIICILLLCLAIHLSSKNSIDGFQGAREFCQSYNMTFVISNGFYCDDGKLLYSIHELRDGTWRFISG